LKGTIVITEKEASRLPLTATRRGRKKSPIKSEKKRASVDMAKKGGGGEEDEGPNSMASDVLTEIGRLR